MQGARHTPAEQRVVLLTPQQLEHAALECTVHCTIQQNGVTHLWDRDVSNVLQCTEWSLPPVGPCSSTDAQTPAQVAYVATGGRGPDFKLYPKPTSRAQAAFIRVHNSCKARNTCLTATRREPGWEVVLVPSTDSSGISGSIPQPVFYAYAARSGLMSAVAVLTQLRKILLVLGIDKTLLTAYTLTKLGRELRDLQITRKKKEDELRVLRSRPYFPDIQQQGQLSAFRPHGQPEAIRQEDIERTETELKVLRTQEGLTHCDLQKLRQFKAFVAQQLQANRQSSSDLRKRGRSPRFADNGPCSSTTLAADSAQQQRMSTFTDATEQQVYMLCVNPQEPSTCLLVRPRPGYQQLMQLAADGRFDVMLCTRGDAAYTKAVWQHILDPNQGVFPHEQLVQRLVLVPENKSKDVYAVLHSCPLILQPNVQDMPCRSGNVAYQVAPQDAAPVPLCVAALDYAAGLYEPLSRKAVLQIIPWEPRGTAAVLDNGRLRDMTAPQHTYEDALASKAQLSEVLNTLDNKWTQCYAHLNEGQTNAREAPQQPPAKTRALAAAAVAAAVTTAAGDLLVGDVPAAPSKRAAAAAPTSAEGAAETIVWRPGLRQHPQQQLQLQQQQERTLRSSISRSSQQQQEKQQLKRPRCKATASDSVCVGQQQHDLPVTNSRQLRRSSREKHGSLSTAQHKPSGPGAVVAGGVQKHRRPCGKQQEQASELSLRQWLVHDRV